MKLLYIGYWGANEGLSQATINPHLEILCQFSEVSKVTYFSLERKKTSKFQIPAQKKIEHIPLFPSISRFSIVNKIYQFTVLPTIITKKASVEAYDFVICRSALAGVYGLKVSKKLDIPLIVESFEPHAQYMLEAGIWKRYGLSFLLQSFWEDQQKKVARALITVTKNYRDHLIAQGIDAAKIFINPCAVDPDKFKFSKKERLSVRERLQIPTGSIVGIYVGKFGGIYFSVSEAFELFNSFFESQNKARLIIVTPNLELVNSLLKKNGINKERIDLLEVQHDQVPHYLSAADLAFSLHKPSLSKKFVSPIKNAEYWANGLPVIISEGIGDDSKQVAENAKLGVLIKNPWTECFEKLQIQEPKTRSSLLNKSERSFNVVKITYGKLFHV